MVKFILFYCAILVLVNCERLNSSAHSLEGKNGETFSVDNIEESKENVEYYFSDVQFSSMVGGTEAKVGQFSFHVSLYINVANKLSQCGGILIKPNWILTVIHPPVPLPFEQTSPSSPLFSFSPSLNQFVIYFIAFLY